MSTSGSWKLPVFSSRYRSIRIAAAFTVAVASLGAGPAGAEEIMCSVKGDPLETSQTQIFFNSTDGSCAITDAGPATDNGLRVFLLPKFATPTILGQKVMDEETSPGDHYSTSWTNVAASDGPHATGYRSRDLGTFTTSLTSELDGIDYTMDVMFTVSEGYEMMIEDARVTYTLGDGPVVAGNLPTTSTR